MRAEHWVPLAQLSSGMRALECLLAAAPELRAEHAMGLSFIVGAMRMHLEPVIESAITIDRHLNFDD